ncbi:DUF3231 family protein [Paenibacillus sp. YYML68]|uniref:DUF3231 family protein n=1 Tax=Paenibacillus sp. YYML68 TaxID=2909250 RepID=UPI002490D63E|nr:DUF3231 family protein [Paenibacillus sp. YYML68]
MNTNMIPLTSTEFGNLWMTYQEKTMLLRLLEHFLEHADEETRTVFQKAYDQSEQTAAAIRDLFRAEGAVIPHGFTEKDVYNGAPKLFDYQYDLMFMHMMSKIETNLFAVYSTMSYRSDIRQFFNKATAQSLESFNACTELLLERGVLARSPYMSLPKEVHYIVNHDYLNGNSLFKEKRALNAIEISLIHHAIETNLTGMQLMIGFAQVADHPEVRQYFITGMELSKHVETTLGEYLRDDFIEPPATHAGKATASRVAPFSDKLMLYLTNLLTAFGLGSNALGGAFSLRSDLPVTMALLARKIVPFLKEGGQLMIKHGWMEEPPHVEDRRQLTR